MKLSPLDLSRTALVLIDLQQGIVAMPTAPRLGPEVVERAARLADAFRGAKALVVLVHVGFSTDGRDALRPEVDVPMPGGQRPAGWSDLVPEIGPRPGDLVIFKHQWGAFYGTELDLQLRRRQINTIVLSGIATNMGVESTARDAFERGYHQIFVEDAMTSRSEEGHLFSVKNILPLMGRVRSTKEVLAACAATGR